MRAVYLACLKTRVGSGSKEPNEHIDSDKKKEESQLRNESYLFRSKEFFKNNQKAPWKGGKIEFDYRKGSRGKETCRMQKTEGIARPLWQKKKKSRRGGGLILVGLCQKTEV